MRELPKVFASEINKDLNNTQELFYGSERQINKSNDNLNIGKKINDIFSSPNHVYKSKVKIIYNDKEEIHTIIGKTNTNLITIEGNFLKINDIMDIERI